ncbi:MULTISPECIES: CD3324 family protein [unclassified Clostridioides]|uniref:CD3324 family protein n=1 Tax=unclassified Clostridioides TaxID=2635829 RepID=UPI001D0C4B08|nr:DNA-binding response regulator [Clostridioides sp. ES-S-0001-02]MCC0639517.1 DNA-binding response regulator [Clostridioides sp. ES-S-0049-03]MCC0651440.1 DNA-binding response regulator [Clostridioides sp. ES-S-0001-03]MCC0655778.1 DNA-binding response regulator [Clostridioides sp. ES-S-0123-01]MCC0673963.1 DNA-binding response regulator [Clostridioides sp. ES-S-0145-01]MCC0676557.1 DNA-binding response regulator [Clostridioides sp. ES-W-0018-02]MCC0680565.1 DNA-binding response regulator [
MKYEKAQNILPEEILELIQEYTDGSYLYIPRKSENKKAWGENSGSRNILKERNREILDKYNKGISVKELTKDYYLTEHSIRRIIREEKSD